MNHHIESDKEHSTLDELITLRDWLRYTVTYFNRTGLFHEHDNLLSFDEATRLLLSTLLLPHQHFEYFLDACIPTEERQQLFDAIEHYRHTHHSLNK